MAHAEVEERQLLKAMTWWDGFVVALCNPAFLMASLGASVGALGTTGRRRVPSAPRFVRPWWRSRSLVMLTTVRGAWYKGGVPIGTSAALCTTEERTGQWRMPR